MIMSQKIKIIKKYQNNILHDKSKQQIKILKKVIKWKQFDRPLNEIAQMKTNVQLRI